MTRQSFFLFIFLSFFLSISAFTDDLTKTYQQVWEDIDSHFTEATVQRLRGYTILFIPGFLSNAVIDMGEKIRLGEYFDEQMTWLASLGIETERVDIESEGSPQENAIRIVRSIHASQKPVLILAHSKGGLDTLEALLTHKEILEKVRGFLPIQSPFFGSPLADWVSEDRVLNVVSKNLLEALGGTKASLESLQTGFRHDYFLLHESAIYEILEVIPTISISTWKKNEEWEWDSVLEWLRNIMESRGILSDGAVPKESAIYPHTDFITLEGVDHVMTVMHCSISEFDRVRFTKTLLVLLLQRNEEFK